jgi:hypothetical protein
MSCDVAHAYRAAVATRVLAMLAPADTSEIAAAMAAPPIVERAVVRESRIPLLVSLALLMAGVVFGMLIRQSRPPTPCRTKERVKEEQVKEDDEDE